jgi:hypothetical protein
MRFKGMGPIINDRFNPIGIHVTEYQRNPCRDRIVRSIMSTYLNVFNI